MFPSPNLQHFMGVARFPLLIGHLGFTQLPSYEDFPPTIVMAFKSRFLCFSISFSSFVSLRRPLIHHRAIDFSSPPTTSGRREAANVTGE